MPATKIGGIVLCGGKSSRMGQPKAWLPFGEEVLLQRVVRVLSEVISPIVVVAAPNQDLPTLPEDVEIVRDEREYLGPLNGLARGLTALNGRIDAAYLSSCDVPFLTANFVRHVIRELGTNEICLPEVGGFMHPLAGVYRMTVLPTVRELIAANRLRMSLLVEQLPTRVLTANDFVVVDPTLQSLRNVNTPEDYAAAFREAGIVGQ